jgi:hypothetical protein
MTAPLNRAVERSSRTHRFHQLLKFFPKLSDCDPERGRDPGSRKVGRM